MRKHRILHAASTAATVLDHKVMVTIQDAIVPRQQRAIAFKQSLTKAICEQLSALKPIDVIVHLDVSDAIFPYHSIHDRVEVGADIRITHIQQESRMINHPSTVAHEKPGIRLVLQGRLDFY